MAPTIWIDGQYYDKANAKVSVFDHGLLYGDGVFEGIRVYDRRVFRLDKHLDRLYHSAKGAWLEIPMTKAELRRLVEEAVAKSGLADADMRLPGTGGVGMRGRARGSCVKRDAVNELAREATYGIEEVPLNRYDLYTADEVFFTGTAAEIVGVSKLDARVIGAGVPGPVTKELSKRFKALATRGD